MNNHNTVSNPSSIKLVYWIILAAFSLVLIFRLGYLQILHTTEYRLQSDKNRIREVNKINADNNPEERRHRIKDF